MFSWSILMYDVSVPNMKITMNFRHWMNMYLSIARQYGFTFIWMCTMFSNMCCFISWLQMKMNNVFISWST